LFRRPAAAQQFFSKTFLTDRVGWIYKPDIDGVAAGKAAWRWRVSI
jgi:hypothetical protein